MKLLLATEFIVILILFTWHVYFILFYLIYLFDMLEKIILIEFN